MSPFMRKRHYARRAERIQSSGSIFNACGRVHLIIKGRNAVATMNLKKLRNKTLQCDCADLLKGMAAGTLIGLIKVPTHDSKSGLWSHLHVLIE